MGTTLGKERFKGSQEMSVIESARVERHELLFNLWKACLFIFLIFQINVFRTTSVFWYVIPSLF